jgi:acyl carrier protein
MNETAPVDEARIIDAMREVLAKRFGIKRSSLDLDQPIESLGLDSMSFVEYVFDLETELNIIFPDVPTHLVTLRDFVQFVCDEVTIQRRRDGATGAE